MSGPRHFDLRADPERDLGPVVAHLREGGVIAYPTEGVFGLGCLPDDPEAVERVLDIKQRNASKGLILIAARVEQLSGWVDSSLLGRIPEPDPRRPVTWIVKPTREVPALITGDHAGLARVRRCRRGAGHR